VLWSGIEPIRFKNIRSFGAFTGGISNGSGSEQLIYSYEIGKRLKGLIFSVYGKPYQSFKWILKLNNQTISDRGIIDFTTGSNLLDPTIDPWLATGWSERMLPLEDGDKFELFLVSSEAVGYSYHVAGFIYEP